MVYNSFNDLTELINSDETSPSGRLISLYMHIKMNKHQ